MEWLDTVIEEYKTLRAESLTAIQTQQAVIRYGLAIVGVLVATALNTWDKLVLSAAVFLVFLPIVCYLILMIWMGEVARMMRVGRYLYGLEKRINEFLNGQVTLRNSRKRGSAVQDDENSQRPVNSLPALYWETSLRDLSKKDGTPQLTWSYLAILGILLFFAIASIVFGNYRIWNDVSSVFLVFTNVIEFVVFGIAFIILLHTGMRFR